MDGGCLLATGVAGRAFFTCNGLGFTVAGGVVVMVLLLNSSGSGLFAVTLDDTAVGDGSTVFDPSESDLELSEGDSGGLGNALGAAMWSAVALALGAELAASSVAIVAVLKKGKGGRTS